MYSIHHGKMKNIEDFYLLQKLKEDDIAALEVIFNKYYTSLCRYLTLIFKNQIIVEHIVQDLFLYIWENRKKIEINTSLSSYLYTAARYKALNKIRDNKKFFNSYTEFENLHLEENKNPDKIIEIQELQNLIDKAIETLPPRCQQIFKLSKEENLTYEEIANLMGISIKTVENQMNIALKKLRKFLRPFYFKILMSL